ncbi:MAG: hypothetical protein WA432_04175 [Candidatus Babeliaceae bacterium]
MKKIFYVLNILIIFTEFLMQAAEIEQEKGMQETEISHMPARQTDINDLKRKIEKQKEIIRTIVLSVPESKDYVERIETLQKQIHSLEDHAGRNQGDGKSIAQLQHKVDKIRYEICVEQQRDPHVKSLMVQIEKIRNEIDQKTELEQKKINHFATQLNNLDKTTEEAKNIIQKIKNLENIIKDKSASLIQKMKPLQKKIEEKMTHYMEQAQDLIDAIQTKYEPIKRKINHFDEQLATILDEFNQLLADKQDALQAARQELFKLKMKLIKLEPCQKPHAAFIPTWEVFFM